MKKLYQSGLLLVLIAVPLALSAQGQTAEPRVLQPDVPDCQRILKDFPTSQYAGEASQRLSEIDVLRRNDEPTRARLRADATQQLLIAVDEFARTRRLARARETARDG